MNIYSGSKLSHDRKKGDEKNNSSFRALVGYLLRGEEEPLIYTRVTNCGFEDPALAIKEIEAKQQRNTRSQADKTFHLVVSFPCGEKPTVEQLENIEDELCQSVGLGAHQRISCVHGDTDNLHLHVAVNKIHPETHRNVELIRDYYRLDEACRRLEIKHGLYRDNRIDREGWKQKQKPERIRTMEAHSEKESFNVWLHEHGDQLRDALGKAESWNDLHQSFRKYGLSIEPKGAGLVIVSDDRAIDMKASRLGKEFSRPQLEQKIGKYQANPDRDLKLGSYDKNKLKPFDSEREIEQAAIFYKKQ